MHSLENWLPDTLLLQVWVQLFLIFLVKVFSLLLSVELDFKLEHWLPGLCNPSLYSFFAQTEQVERNYIKEKKAAVKEFEDKKVELKENLIAELEEKKKMIENEKLTMELTGGMKAPAGFWDSWWGCLGRHSSYSCFVSEFLIRAKQAKRRVGFDMTGQSCINSSVLYWLYDSVKWDWLYPISQYCD